MEQPNEIWNVDVDGAVYEADTETLRQWIVEGHVTPQTRVQKGSLKWIELARVPAFRGLFDGAAAAPPPPSPAFAAPAASPYWQPTAPAPPPSAGDVCVNHPASPSKFVCQSCDARLCAQCVKRYSQAAVCSLCGELCRPASEAVVHSQRRAELARGFGLPDFALAFRYPFKDPIALVFVAILYGFLMLFGTFGRLFATGMLFGYVSHAVRRVSMGHYDEGPSPDLSDPADVMFNAIRLGLAVTIVTIAPLVLVITFALTHVTLDDNGLPNLASAGAAAVGFLLALAWAALYYPMALLVAGYTNAFFSTINPIIGVSTVLRLGFDYVKAYAMCLVVLGLQIVCVLLVGLLGPIADVLPNKVLAAVAYFVQYVLQGGVVFVASMITAAVLGLVLYKRPDVIGADDV